MGALHNIIDVLTYSSYELKNNKNIFKRLYFYFLKNKLRRRVKKIYKCKLNYDTINDIIILHQGIELNNISGIEVISDITLSGTYNIQFNSKVNSIRVSIKNNNISINYYNKNTLSPIRKIYVDNYLDTLIENNDLSKDVIQITIDLLHETLMEIMNIYFNKIGGKANGR